MMKFMKRLTEAKVERNVVVLQNKLAYNKENDVKELCADFQGSEFSSIIFLQQFLDTE